jgi:hypothetical protein
MARALVPNAFVLTKKPDGVLHYEEWEQLVSYHSGVGTFDGNSVLGGKLPRRGFRVRYTVADRAQQACSARACLRSCELHTASW